MISFEAGIFLGVCVAKGKVIPRREAEWLMISKVKRYARMGELEAAGFISCPEGKWLVHLPPLAPEDRTSRFVARDTPVPVVTPGVCAYCGKPATEMDHVRPLSRGGRNRKANRVPACSSCNIRKGDRTPEEAGMAFQGGVHAVV